MNIEHLKLSYLLANRNECFPTIGPGISESTDDYYEIQKDDYLCLNQYLVSFKAS